MFFTIDFFFNFLLGNSKTLFLWNTMIENVDPETQYRRHIPDGKCKNKIDYENSYPPCTKLCPKHLPLLSPKYTLSTRTAHHINVIFKGNSLLQITINYKHCIPAIIMRERETTSQAQLDSSGPFYRQLTWKLMPSLPIIPPHHHRSARKPKQSE